MSAASVLRSFSPSAMPGPVMPMDVAMRFYISHSPPPLRGFLSSYEDLHRAQNRVQNRDQNQNRAQNRPTSCSRQQNLYKPLRPCISSQRDDGADHGDHGDGDHGDGWSSKMAKKKVVFADSKGMSLTNIHVFSRFDDEPYRHRGEELQFDLSDLETAAMQLQAGAARRLELDFKPPSADYLDFRNRLIRNSVCLESCSLQQRSLSGTVKVRNVGFHKSVLLRATFDSWASFTDVACSFMNNVYGCQDNDTFAFELELPADVPPQNRVEFCICFRVRDQTYWDNNDGRNYALRHAGWSGEELLAPPPPPQQQKKKPEVKLLDLDLDQFGSPRTSSGLFPGWQSWGQIENAVPYW